MAEDTAPQKSDLSADAPLSVEKDDYIREPISPLFTPNPIFKPFRYPWAFEAWLTQQRLHWLPDEVPMADDVKDWQKKLTPAEKNLLTQIFRFFTQMDIGVNDCYMQYYSQLFQPIEIRMMLAAFSNIETIHIQGYAHLLETLGIPESEYQAFLDYKVMRDKWDYMQQFDGKSLGDIALKLALFSAFTEGVALFASFVMLMNFPRFNKMKGMGQIVSWSVRDETLHVHSMTRLFRTLIDDHPSIWTEGLREKIRMICKQVVGHEDLFIDLAFEMGPIEGLSAEETKQYIRFIANRRLGQLGLDPLYDVHKDPLPWMDDMTSAIEFTNFFENRATEYSKAATEGSWDDAFDNIS
jgi:ribonucleoside-diphosphate reductase beta chain